ncbi:MAG: hypothetical protein ACM31C_12905 [Acidobacteriota bacterium]
MKWAALGFVAGCSASSPPPASPAAPAAPAAFVDVNVIEKTEHGGVIELVGDEAPAMKRANELMTQHCGAFKYSVLSEAPITNGSGQTIAWRVSYQCN